MGTQVDVGVFGPAEATDLAGALAVRGLIGNPTAKEGGWWVELHEPHEEPARFLGEVAAAVGAWLADRGMATAEIRTGESVLSIRAGEQLDDALRARLPRRRGTRR